LLRRITIPLAAVALAIGALAAAGNAAAAPRAPAHSAARALPAHFNPGGTLIKRGTLHVAAHHGIRGAEVTSTNWSGYAVSGSNGTYKTVSASWKQPTAHCSGSRRSTTYAAFWVGLDGYSSSSVEQTGTLIECVGSSASYFGWYEMYPAGLVTYSKTLRAGDSITASVTFSGTETYTLVLTDATQGWTETTAKNQSGLARSSAEVITEAPCCTSSGGILPLANFGTVNYSGSSDNGSSMGTQSPTEIIIVDTSGNQEDSTSAISSTGAFSNTWIRST
jgi:Peptidase A4 family